MDDPYSLTHAYARLNGAGYPSGERMLSSHKMVIRKMYSMSVVGLYGLFLFSNEADPNGDGGHAFDRHSRINSIRVVLRPGQGSVCALPKFAYLLLRAC